MKKKETTNNIKKIKLNRNQLINLFKTEQDKLNAARMQLNTLQKIAIEQQTTLNTLKELKKSKKGQEVMISIGSGIFCEAKLGEVKQVEGSLTENILIKKTTENAIKEIEKKIKKTKESIKRLGEEATKINTNLINLEKLINPGIKKQ